MSPIAQVLGLVLIIGGLLVSAYDRWGRLPIGTRSILAGAHTFWIHPWFVAWGWWKLYGFPWDPRLWVAFFVHDLGYWGSPNMDGEEGERHPEVSARWMTRWFDGEPTYGSVPAAGQEFQWRVCFEDWDSDRDFLLGPWGQLVLFHSRFYAKANKAQPSRLCFADKMAIVLTPAWLYLPLVRASGEIHEYRKVAAQRKEGAHERPELSDREWYTGLQEYMAEWIDEHVDGREDTWTPASPERKAADRSGVWK